MLGLFSESTIQSNDAIITKVNVGNLRLGWHLLQKGYIGGNTAYCQGREQSGKLVTKLLWQLDF